jgi:hypothetical protein
LHDDEGEEDLQTTRIISWHLVARDKNEQLKKNHKISQQSEQPVSMPKTKAGPSEHEAG